MITKVSTVRNKLTGQVFEVVPGTLLPDFFEEVVKDIKIGEPKIEYEIEEQKDEPAEEKVVEKKPKTSTQKPKAKKTTKKGVKKDDNTK